MSLSNLANTLSTQFKITRDINQLEEAICLEREALELCPEGHPKHYDALWNLGVDLHTHFKHAKTIEVLREAMLINGKALELCPDEDRDRS
ncbi:hypothetical protein NMY22_g12014 [Coprinellus aureogranulatus]|nr:hypothetical protein NMY22_g12014 [Coprinellus aureogranulatus]